MALAVEVKGLLPGPGNDFRESAVDEFINEIDREMREDRWRQLWRRYGVLVIAAALGVVLFVAGRQGFVAWQESSRNSAANAYLAALGSEGPSALEGLAAEGGEGYPMLARFQLAVRLVEAGDNAAAEQAYLDLAGDGSIGDYYRDAALILSVMNAGPATAVPEREARLSPLAEGEGPWRYLAGEVLIGLALEHGDRAAASERAARLREIGDLPPDIEQRLRLLETALGE